MRRLHRARTHLCRGSDTEVRHGGIGVREPRLCGRILGVQCNRAFELFERLLPSPDRALIEKVASLQASFVRLGGRHVPPVARKCQRPDRARREEDECQRCCGRPPGISARAHLGLNRCRCGCRYDRLYRRDQPVAAARNRFDVPGSARTIAQSLAQRINRHCQHIVGDAAALPDALHQVFLRDGLIRALGETHQHIHYTRLDADLFIAAHEQVPCRRHRPLPDRETVGPRFVAVSPGRTHVDNPWYQGIHHAAKHQSGLSCIVFDFSIYKVQTPRTERNVEPIYKNTRARTGRITR